MAKRIDATIQLAEDFIEDLVSKIVEYGELGDFPSRRLAHDQYGADAMLEKEPNTFLTFGGSGFLTGADQVLYRPPPGKRVILLIQGTSNHGGTGSQIYFFRESEAYNDDPFYIYERKLGDITYHQYRYGKRGVTLRQNQAIMIRQTGAGVDFFCWMGVRLVDGDR